MAHRNLSLRALVLIGVVLSLIGTMMAVPNRAALAADSNFVWDVLDDGARRASAIAAETIAEVKATVGLP